MSLARTINRPMAMVLESEESAIPVDPAPEGVCPAVPQRRYKDGQSFMEHGVLWTVDGNNGWLCGSCKSLVRRPSNRNRTGPLEDHVLNKKCKGDRDRVLRPDACRMHVRPGGNVVVARGIIPVRLLSEAHAVSGKLNYEFINLRGDCIHPNPNPNIFELKLPSSLRCRERHEEAVVQSARKDRTT